MRSFWLIGALVVAACGSPSEEISRPTQQLDATTAGDVLYERDAIATPIAVTSTVNHDFDVPVTGLIDTISVHVRLTHTYIGDLTMKLRAPNGTEVTLHNRTGTNGQRIDLTYGDGGAPISGIEQLFGADVNGTWRLSIVNTCGTDNGTLEYVKLTVGRSR
jgi:subtilisin-like proprotein convertase family protein